MSVRPWSLEQALAVAPARVGAARPLAVPALWSDTGVDERALWGRHVGARAEPYTVMVDHAPLVGDLAAHCSCPSRVSPCKHAVALLVLWAQGDVAVGPTPAVVTRWLASRPSTASPTRPSRERQSGAPAGESSPRPTPTEGPTIRDERLRRLEGGLADLERWIDDRVRVGLGDPSIARYGTWDDLAVRLVDAQAGGLANRVRRVAGLVGTSPDWHRNVLAELGVLHVLARAGQRLSALEPPWRDGIASAVGITVRQSDVRAQVPDTATWAVMGRSDTVEDRIVVRRTWLRALDGHGRDRPDDGWAMVLSFAAHGQALESPVDVGAVLTADLHRYSGTVPLRCLIGVVHDGPHDDDHGDDQGDVQDVRASADVVSVSPSIAAARASVGRMLADEPWLERAPLCVSAAPTVVDGRWSLADHSGALPIVEGGDLPTLLAASGGRPVTVTAEWTPLGALPLTVHLEDRALDIAGRPAWAGAR